MDRISLALQSGLCQGCAAAGGTPGPQHPAGPKLGREERETPGPPRPGVGSHQAQVLRCRTFPASMGWKGTEAGRWGSGCEREGGTAGSGGARHCSPSPQVPAPPSGFLQDPRAQAVLTLGGSGPASSDAREELGGSVRGTPAPQPSLFTPGQTRMGGSHDPWVPALLRKPGVCAGGGALAAGVSTQETWVGDLLLAGRFSAPPL